MTDAVKYKGFEIFADGFGRDGGDKWQPTLYIGKRDAATDQLNEKQYWAKYPKQFYPSRKGAADMALIAGKAIIDGKMPGFSVKDL